MTNAQSIELSTEPSNRENPRDRPLTLLGIFANFLVLIKAGFWSYVDHNSLLIKRLTTGDDAASVAGIATMFGWRIDPGRRRRKP